MFQALGKFLRPFPKFPISHPLTFSLRTLQTLISPAELNEKMKSDKNLRVIDTRQAESFHEGHIPSAVNMDLFFNYIIQDSTPETMSKLRNDFGSNLGQVGISRDHSIVTYEHSMDTRKGASCRAFFLLKYLGVQNVSVLHGGLSAWEKAGLPISSKVQQVQAAAFKTDMDLQLMADKNEVCAALDNPNASIVDCRDIEEWIGVSSSSLGMDYCPRKGRIPGSIWIPWLMLMETNAEGIALFKEPSKIREICAEAGLEDQNKEIIIYCFKGARASNTQFAMQRAGFKFVKNYFASWNEWSRDTKMPVDSRIFCI